ncbi:ArsR/SmtB family transcription factor [Nonomuraea sp. NPDC050790]|uniref:ArsR/SmtB family transcription factor n=1 Tax=Nonomuraea sp. NPDC050790 TaxID=3364371 RepID=UPI0037AA9CD2
MSHRHSPLSDPKAMRALAHPARLEMLNRLQVEGPSTATEVAEFAGVTPSAASYHLRMLAKYGFVEDAPPRTDGRERVWRSTGRGLSVATEPDDAPELRAAKELLIHTVYDEAHADLKRSMGRVDREPEQWRAGAAWRRIFLQVGPEEMRRLGEQMEALLLPYQAGVRKDAPPDARTVVAQYSVYLRPERPVPGLPTEDHDAV